MTWTKLGAEFPSLAHDLSDGAFRLLVEMWCWSNARGLDLVIPKRDVRRLAETDDPDTAVKELVAAGWVEDRGDAWYAGVRCSDWQLERRVVEHRRQQSALTSQRHRRHAIGDHSICLPKNCRAVRDDDRHRSRHASHDTSRERSPGTERNGSSYGSDVNDDGGRDDGWPNVALIPDDGDQVCATRGHVGAGWRIRRECPDCTGVSA